MYKKEKIKENYRKRSLVTIGVVIVILFAVIIWQKNRPLDLKSNVTQSEEARSNADLREDKNIQTEYEVASERIADQEIEKQTKPSPIDSNTALISIGAEENSLTFNARGELPRLNVSAEEEILTIVSFPNAKEGQRISVQAEDGGKLLGDAVNGFVMVDGNLQVNVKFQTSNADGLHRVTLRNGGESRVLQFWVGPEPPVLVRN